MADTNSRHGVRGIVTTNDSSDWGKQRALAARGATVALVIGVIAFLLQAAVTFTPAWGYFGSPYGRQSEHGYFGPWKVCQTLTYERERCGTDVSRFRPNQSVQLGGIAAAGASIFLAIFVLLAVLQLSMASSAKRTVISYSSALISKVTLATLATCLAIVAAGLFALQTDDRANSFEVTRGEGFYMQLGSIALNFGVLVSSIYEGIYARRGGDPTKLRDVADMRSTTINNPGYREGNHHPRNGGSISMTDASGKPYSGSTGNGSMASVTTSVGSTASPLRSSLKKPKPLGIQNPGFSSHSPTLTRNGSQKKVRIQTHSTEV